LVTF
jgi:hypothetical protein